MTEEWRPVPGYENYYIVSSFGQVKSLPRLVKYPGEHKEYKKGIVLKQERIKKGYLRVLLCKNGTNKRILVHRLVWEAFNGPIPEGMQVNHINENKEDNRLENLNLMTAKENINWGTKKERQSVYFTNGPTSKKIMQLNLTGILIREWPSMAEVNRVLKITQGNISACCRGVRKTAGGYIWKYAE